MGDGKWRFVPVLEFAEAFQQSPIGQANAKELSQPFQKTELSDSALIRRKYALSCTPGM